MAHKTFCHRKDKQCGGNPLPSFSFLQILQKNLERVCISSACKICKNGENLDDSICDVIDLFDTADID